MCRHYRCFRFPLSLLEAPLKIDISMMLIRRLDQEKKAAEVCYIAGSLLGPNSW